MDSREVTGKQYYKKCPECKKEIKGSTEAQVQYNLGIHIKAKHENSEVKA